MEHKIGRPLRKGESVHHRNHVKLDNRPNNLELWIKGHPNGMRVSDAIEWARDILRLYDPPLLALT